MDGLESEDPHEELETLVLDPDEVEIYRFRAWICDSIQSVNYQKHFESLLYYVLLVFRFVSSIASILKSRFKFIFEKLKISLKTDENRETEEKNPKENKENKENLLLSRPKLLILILCVVSRFPLLFGYSKSIMDDAIAVIKNPVVSVPFLPGTGKLGPAPEVEGTLNRAMQFEKGGAPGTGEVDGVPPSVWQWIGFLMSRDFWGLPLYKDDPQVFLHGRGPKHWTHKSFRPITTATFRLNRILERFHEFIFSFHQVNLLIHILTSLVLYRFAKLLFEHRKDVDFVSLLSASIFAVHPAGTEATCYLVGRADLLVTLCGLLSLHFYLKKISLAPSDDDRFEEEIISIEERIQPDEDSFNRFLQTLATQLRNPQIMRIFLATLFILLTGLTKEVGFTLFGFFVIADLTSLYHYAYRATSRASPHFQRVTKRFLLARVGLVLLLGLTTISMRMAYTGGSVKLDMSVQDNPVSFEEDGGIRKSTYAYIHGLYARLVIFPFYQSYDYSFNAIPLLRAKFEDPRLMLACIFYTSFLSILLYAMTRPWKSLKINRLEKLREFAEFGEFNSQLECSLQSFLDCRALILILCWYSITFLPASNLFFPIGTVVGERMLYIFQVSTCLLAGYLIPRLYSRLTTSMTRAYYKFGLFFYFLIFLGQSLWRTYLWWDDDLLFIADGASFAESAKTQFNLAITWMNRARFLTADEATHVHRESVRAFWKCAYVDPLSVLAYWRIGQIFLTRLDFHTAEMWLAEATKSGMFGATLLVRDEEVFNDHAIALFHTGRIHEAIHFLLKAVGSNHYFAKGMSNLACAYVRREYTETGDIERAAMYALPLLVDAIRIVPDHEIYWKNLFFVHNIAPRVTQQQIDDIWNELNPTGRAVPFFLKSSQDCIWEFAPAA